MAKAPEIRSQHFKVRRQMLHEALVEHGGGHVAVEQQEAGLAEGARRQIGRGEPRRGNSLIG